MPCANRKRVSWCLVVLPRISQYSGCKKSLKSITIRTLLNVIALAPTPWHPHHNDGEPWSSWSIWHGEGRALKWIKWRGVRSLIWLYRRHKDPPRAYSALAFYRHTWVCVCVLNEVHHAQKQLYIHKQLNNTDPAPCDVYQILYSMTSNIYLPRLPLTPFKCHTKYIHSCIWTKIDDLDMQWITMPAQDYSIL